MGLKDDNIYLQINVGVSQASANIHKLSEENRKLAESSKEARERMAELKAQGEKNSEEYKQLDSTIKANTDSIKANIKEIIQQEKSLGLNEKTMLQLKRQAQELQTQLDRTVESADPKGYADLQKQLEAVKGRMGELRSSGQSLSTQLQNIPGPAGVVTKGVMGIHKAFLTLLANPIIAIIAAVAAIFMALYKAISTSEEATNKLNVIMAPLAAWFDKILNVVQKVVIGLLDFITAIIEFVRTASEKLPIVGKYFKEINDYEREAIELEKSKQALVKKERDTLVENAEAEMKVSKLRTEAKRKDLFSADERIAKIEEAMKLEQEMADKEHANALERLRIAEAEAARAGNTTETERKLAELKADTFKAEKQYHDHSRELTEQLNTARNEIATEEKNRQKELLDKQIERVDKAIAHEKAQLIKSRLNKEIDDKSFNEKMEQLEIEALNRKLEIHGLDKTKRDEISRAILDAKLKILQEEEKTTKELTEKLRVDALSKNEKELDNIRQKYKEREKLLIESKEKGLITELEYSVRLQAQADELQKEIDKKKEEQQSAKAAEELAKKDQAHEQEKMRVMEQYANNEITQFEYQQRLLELEQQYLDEKLRINGLSEEQITKLKEQQLNKQIALHEKSMQKQAETQKKYMSIATSAAGQLGEIMGNMALGAESTAEEMQYQMVMLALDTLKQIVLIASAEAMAKMIAQLGPIFGPIAGAAAVGLINGAFTAVKSKVKRPAAKNKGDGDLNSSNQISGSYQVDQYAKGKYDVIGSEDGKRYKDVEYIGSPETGIVKQPALIAEQGEELIISSPDLQLLKKHVNYPYIVSAINDVRSKTVQQRASGNYSSLGNSPLESRVVDPELYNLIGKIGALLEKMDTNGVRSYVGLDEMDAQRKLRDDSRAIGTLKRS